MVLGKISDPALDELNNIYRRALNEGRVLHMLANPTLKDGLCRLYTASTLASFPGDPQPIRERVQYSCDRRAL